MASDAQTAQNAVQNNAYARSIILNTARLADQQIASINQSSYPYTPGQATVISIPVKPTGLVKRFFVCCTFNLAPSAGETQTLTSLGLSNVFSNITLNDLSNVQRINTTSQHLMAVTSARRNFPVGASIVTAGEFGWGNNRPVISAPPSFTSAEQAVVCFEIPVAYSDTDLRGAIWANVVQATMSLNLTINPLFFTAAGADKVNSVYNSSSSALGTIPSYTINVYQEYWDQLPLANGLPILPQLDIGTMYQLISASYTGIVPNTNYSIPFQAFRQYYSAVTVFDNGGVLNNGSDINYWSLTSANALTNFQRDPQMQSFRNRLQFNIDRPLGVDYFDFRTAPINTTAQGVTTLNLNAKTADTGAALYCGFEFFALLNQLNMMGSIASQ